MHFSCEELEKRFLRTLNEEQAQGDAFATFLMLCCCAINWFILSGPYGHFLPQPLHMVILSSLAVISLAVQLMITVPKLSVVYKHNRTLIMGIVRVNCTAVTTLTYGPTHGQHPTITTALSTTRMPAYHCYLESKIPNDTTLLHLVHYVADGMPIVPAFVALVFPLPFHAHIALLLTSHAHLILSQWYDCIRLVAYPVTGAAYRTGTLDIMANPDAATEAVQVCRHISIVGQVAMLAVFAVYSWYAPAICYLVLVTTPTMCGLSGVKNMPTDGGFSKPPSTATLPMAGTHSKWQPQSCGPLGPCAVGAILHCSKSLCCARCAGQRSTPCVVSTILRYDDGMGCARCYAAVSVHLCNFCVALGTPTSVPRRGWVKCLGLHMLAVIGCNSHHHELMHGGVKDKVACATPLSSPAVISSIEKQSSTSFSSIMG